MPIDLAGAQAQQRTNMPRIQSTAGAHNAHWIGTGEIYKDYSMNGCKTCGKPAVDKQTGEVLKGEPNTKGNGCVNCDNTGLQPEQRIQLLYCLEDGTQEAEAVAYKLSPPRQFGNGRQSRPSKMYERFQAFSGLNDPAEIIKWASDLPEAIEVPVTVIIKQNMNGYLKITEVVGRRVPDKAIEPKARRTRAATPPAEDPDEDGDIPF